MKKIVFGIFVLIGESSSLMAFFPDLSYSNIPSCKASKAFKALQK